MRSAMRAVLTLLAVFTPAICGDASGRPGVVPAGRATVGQSGSLREEASAVGLGVNMPLVGRLIGAGNTLYISTVDVTARSST